MAKFLAIREKDILTHDATRSEIILASAIEFALCFSQPYFNSSAEQIIKSAFTVKNFISKLGRFEVGDLDEPPSTDITRSGGRDTKPFEDQMRDWAAANPEASSDEMVYTALDRYFVTEHGPDCVMWDWPRLVVFCNSEERVAGVMNFSNQTVSRNPEIREGAEAAANAFRRWAITRATAQEEMDAERGFDRARHIFVRTVAVVAAREVYEKAVGNLALARQGFPPYQIEDPQSPAFR